MQIASKKEWIQPSKSPAALNIFIVYKENDSKRQSVINYRELNNIIIKNRYLLPNIQNLQTILENSVIFTKLNQQISFILIKIKPKDK